VAIPDDGTEIPFDLFLGIPKHRVPEVVEKSGMTMNGWIPVDKTT
jgi:sulfide:quinone oxidoreductase